MANELSRYTREMQAMMPQWMRMAHDSDSTGALFLDAFGLEFDDVKHYTDDVLASMFIDGIDVSKIDIVYRVPLTLARVVDFDDIDEVYGYVGEERIEFTVVDRLRHFYVAGPEQSVAILDRAEQIMYIRPASHYIDEDIFVPLTRVDINSTAHYHYHLHHIWNPFDEFGLLLGIDRLNGERNPQFKERILDVFRNPGNATETGMTNGISRELGLSQDDIAVNEMSNKAFRNSLLREDGMPTAKLLGYMDNINSLLGYSWDNMSWGEAYWRHVDENDLGFTYLPHIWDASVANWRKEDFQSGVGDGDDLKVTTPQKQSNERHFDMYVGLKGINEQAEFTHPEMHFKYKLTAEGEVLDEQYRPETYQYSIVASEVIRLYFMVRAYQEYVRETVLDFENTQGYRWDNPSNPNLEVVTGQDTMSPKADPYLEITNFMRTEDEQQTPSMTKFSIWWKDTNGTDHELKLEGQEGLTRNDGMVSTDFVDAFATDEGSVELGYGDFYQRITTEGDWKRGKSIWNAEVLPEGSIRLSPPKQ